MDVKGINNLFDSLMDEFVGNSNNKKESEKIKVSKTKKIKKKRFC